MSKKSETAKPVYLAAHGHLINEIVYHRRQMTTTARLRIIAKITNLRYCSVLYNIHYVRPRPRILCDGRKTPLTN
jgi:hypothetical protein